MDKHLRRLVTPVLVAAGIALVVHVLYTRHEGPLLVQGLKNLQFAEAPLGRALELHGFLRPPLYAVLLWGAVRVGIPATSVNEILFLATLALVAAYARRALPGVHPAWPVLALATSHAVYANLHQPVAEALFALLLVALLLGLVRDAATGDRASLGTVTGALAGLGLSRYVAVFFPAPVVGLNLLLLTPRRLPVRVARAALALFLGLAPVGAWMALARARTGYWTGDDRQAERHLPPSVQHWRELQGLPAHLELTGKTLVIDFFSPGGHAGLAVVTRPYAFGPVETAGVALALLAAIVWLRGVARAGGDEVPADARLRHRARSPGAIVAELLLAFYAVTIAVWTTGNNDPINTRFLFPSYPLLVLGAFHAFAFGKRHGMGRLGRAIFLSLYALVVLVQLWRCFTALPQPIR